LQIISAKIIWQKKPRRRRQKATSLGSCRYLHYHVMASILGLIGLEYSAIRSANHENPGLEFSRLESWSQDV